MEGGGGGGGVRFKGLQFKEDQNLIFWTHTSFRVHQDSTFEGFCGHPGR